MKRPDLVTKYKELQSAKNMLNDTQRTSHRELDCGKFCSTKTADLISPK